MLTLDHFDETKTLEALFWCFMETFDPEAYEYNKYLDQLNAWFDGPRTEPKPTFNGPEKKPFPAWKTWKKFGTVIKFW